jgi:hypothetical protein
MENYMGKLIKRSDKLAFYGITTDDTTVYHRMTGFTEISISKNPKEYTRQYVDEDFEQSDVVGFSPQISFSFDCYSDNLVHKDIVSITDNESLGSDAVREIITVDLTNGNDETGYYAILRKYSVIPDNEGSETDAYTYSGTFKVNSEKTFGKAVSADNFETVTFTQD